MTSPAIAPTTPPAMGALELLEFDSFNCPGKTSFAQIVWAQASHEYEINRQPSPVGQVGGQAGLSGGHWTHRLKRLKLRVLAVVSGAMTAVSGVILEPDLLGRAPVPTSNPVTIRDSPSQMSEEWYSRSASRAPAQGLARTDKRQRQGWENRSWGVTSVS